MLRKRRFLVGLVLLAEAGALFGWAAGPAGDATGASRRRSDCEVVS
jgi:hypothetical protein